MSSYPVTPDGKVLKKIIKEGKGPIPKPGQKVSIHYVGHLTNGHEFDNSRKKGKKLKFTLGQDVVPGVSLGVATMHVGEIAEITVDEEYGYKELGDDNIPPHSTLIYEIELLSIAEIFHNANEAVSYANKIKEQAVVLFHDAKYNEAIDLYKQALRPLRDWVSQNARQTKLILHRNLAICYSKIENWPETLRYAEKVLAIDPNDPKALLRKAEGLIHLKRFEEAKSTIVFGLDLTHNSAAFLEMRKKLIEAQKPEHERQNEVFAKMLQKN